MSDGFEVPHDKLTWRCDLSYLPFTCTAEMTPLEDFVGQERAIRAIEFGLGVNKPGFNIFVTGLTGTGKTSLIRSFLKKITSSNLADPEEPADWCYVYNFAEPIDRAQSSSGAVGASFSKPTWSSWCTAYSATPRKCSKAMTTRVSGSRCSSNCKNSNRR